MTEGVQTVPPAMPASDAWELMRRKRIHHLVVTTGTDILGVLSERDTGSRIGARARVGHTVADFMTSPVVTVGRTDPEIAKDAVHALAAHTGVPNRVTVTVRQGFMALEGTVEWMFQKEAAGSAVMHLEGVKGVSNLIQVKPSASAGQIKTAIDDALLRSAEVDAQHLAVSVNGSIVTLSGHMRSCHEKHEAERAAWAAPGVTRVENLIVVTP